MVAMKAVNLSGSCLCGEVKYFIEAEIEEFMVAWGFFRTWGFFGEEGGEFHK
jgi:hypothetical protein